MVLKTTLKYNFPQKVNKHTHTHTQTHTHTNTYTHTNTHTNTHTHTHIHTTLEMLCGNAWSHTVLAGMQTELLDIAKFPRRSAFMFAFWSSNPSSKNSPWSYASNNLKICRHENIYCSIICNYNISEAIYKPAHMGDWLGKLSRRCAVEY